MRNPEHSPSDSSAPQAHPTPPTLLRPQQVAHILGVTIQTLAQWRCSKRYSLPWVRVGRSIKYRPEDVEAFIEANLHRPHRNGGDDAH